jgi:hypothetical protein
MIGFINIDPQVNGLLVHPQEGHDRCPSPFNSKGREGLNIEVFMEKGDGKHFGRHHRSLSSSPMKSNLDHLYLISIPPFSLLIEERGRFLSYGIDDENILKDATCFLPEVPYLLPFRKLLFLMFNILAHHDF